MKCSEDGPGKDNSANCIDEAQPTYIKLLLRKKKGLGAPSLIGSLEAFGRERGASSLAG